MKKQLPLIVLLIFCWAGAFAQSDLKQVQTNSLWAAAKIKIDGNIAEWKGDFQAYNKNTQLYYILANDDRYIYLTIESADATNIAKIQAGGITLTLNTAGKKKEKDAYMLTYPFVNRAAGRGGFRGQRGGFGGGRNGSPDSAAVAAAHEQFISSSKEIKVSGFKDITDTLISIYNEYSIKAAIGFDAHGAFTYELAVPLKEIGLSADAAKEIAYNIKVNGLQIPGRTIDVNASGEGGFSGGGGFGGGGGRGGNGGGRASMGGRGNINIEEITSPTDFWGKYTLAKK